jgi:eukaryotic-like serine/threonine-protein kinase
MLKVAPSMHVDSFPTRLSVQAGDVIAGKYRVERVLGRGGMSIVVAARHTTLDQAVAIKFQTATPGGREDGVARFLREARAAARIESDHVCRVFDVGLLDTGVPYMVMEHLDGRDLEAELLSRGILPIVEAVDYMLQVLDAIAAAHAMGIVHRDLKPGNLFITLRPDRSRRIKVLDFGISKAERGRDAKLTDTISLVGTPAYMSPEQIRNSKKIDARTDIWSLGIILFELLSGLCPFDGDEIGEILDNVLNKPCRSILELRPDLPLELAVVIDKCLDKKRDARFASAGQLARALAPFGSTSEVSSLRALQLGQNLRGSVRPPMPSEPTLPERSLIEDFALSTNPHLVRPTLSTSPGWASATERPRPRWLGPLLGLSAALTVVGLVSIGVWYSVHTRRNADAHAAAAAATPPVAATALQVEIPPTTVGSAASATAAPSATATGGALPPAATAAARPAIPRSKPARRDSPGVLDTRD